MSEPAARAVRPAIGPLRLAIPPLVVMAVAAAPVGFIGAAEFELSYYGGFNDVGQFAGFLSDLRFLIVIAVAISFVGLAALARACFLPGRRVAPVVLGLGSAYLLGFAAVLASTFPRDPLSTLVFLLLAFALVAPSVAFLYYARGGRRRRKVIS